MSMEKKIEGEKEFNVMARAIGRYIEVMGGKAVVIGGVSVGKKVGALKLNHFIQVEFTGRAPTKKNL